MFFLKVATIFLAVLAVGAEKKIELQDIEEDNLRSELRSDQEKEYDKSDPQHSGPATGPEFNSLDFMKSGLLKLFQNTQPKPPEPPQPQRYVHQYAVTEQPERHAPAGGKAHLASGAAQHAMVGYLSNMPMQIYLVPQYDQNQHSNSHQAVYQPPSAPATASNYIPVQNYLGPRGKPVEFLPPQQPVTYVYHPTPTAHPTLPTVTPVITYQLPVYNVNPRLHVPGSPKPYYSNPEYTDTNAVDELSEQEPKRYSTQTEIPYIPTLSEFPRHYNSRAPIREQFRHPGVPELPRPNPLLYNAPPPHLSNIPRTLPVLHRPLPKPEYQDGELLYNTLHPRPSNNPPFKRRPASLLDSYIPSKLQVEYLKRGLAKDPSALFDALSLGRLPHTIPRHVERGFLPNQMYSTAAGGVTFGHYKRNPKVEKFPHK
ncbi:extensin-2-like [Helicoverpa zea]|uniref:extensin-2-like n=1 Tax=Helicoverpa zea TaxID=7113 RepID=UPI001F5730D1|nr:extensin-2-like [Helicoverpa zea]